MQVDCLEKGHTVVSAVTETSIERVVTIHNLVVRRHATECWETVRTAL